MALKAKVMGREALTKRLNELAPNAEKYAADEKFKIAEEVAGKISEVAPVGATLEYRESIRGDFIKNNPNQKQVGITQSKDPSATGIYAEFIWNWLEFGTAPHSTAKGGGTVLGKKAAAAGGGHMHPGTRAQPHIFYVWRAYRATAKKKIQAAVNRAVREAMGKR